VKTGAKAVALFSKALVMDAEAFLHGQRDFGLLLTLPHAQREPDLLRRTGTRRHHDARAVADHVRSPPSNFTRADSAFVRSAIGRLTRPGYAGYTSLRVVPPPFSFDVPRPPAGLKSY